MSVRAFSEQDIHLALDGELPEEERIAFDAWLATNPDMQARHARFGEDRARLSAALGGLAEEPIPERIMAALVATPEKRSAGSLWKFAAMAAGLLIVGGLGGYLAATATYQPPQPAVAYEIMDGAINAHLMYANEKRHAVEVAANEADHLNGWLSNRVGIKLVAPDLKSQGFELVGGRLLPVGEKPAAQYMYQDADGNRVSLFVTRYEQGSAKAYDVLAENGAEAHFWQEQGYGCAITGTLPEARMTAISKVAYAEFLKAVGVSGTSPGRYTE